MCVCMCEGHVCVCVCLNLDLKQRTLPKHVCKACGVLGIDREIKGR